MFRTYSCLILFLCGFVVSNCTPTTGSRLTPSQTSVGNIKTIGIAVKKDEAFSVRLSREEYSATGLVVGQILLGPAGGLIGTGAEAAQRRSTDQGIEEQFKPVVGNYDPEKELGDKLRYHLQSAKLFTDGLVLDAQDDGRAKGKGLGGLLKVTLREWGLRRCVGPEENVQVGLNVKGELLLEGGTAIWERDELYLEGTCRPWRDFLSNEGSLKDALSSAIDNLAGKMTNELLFP